MARRLHSYKWFKIILDSSPSREQIEALLSRLALDKYSHRMIFESRVGGIRGNLHLIAIEENRVDFVQDLFAQIIPEARFQSYRRSLDDHVEDARRITLSDPKLALKTDRVEYFAHTIQSAMKSAIEPHADEEIMIQISIGGHYPATNVDDSFLRLFHSSFVDFLAGNPQSLSAEEIRGIREKFATAGFKVNLRYGIHSPNLARRIMLRQRMENAIKIVEMVGSNIRFRKIKPNEINYAMLPNGANPLLSPKEMISFLGWLKSSPEFPKSLAPPRDYNARERVIGNATAEDLEDINLGISSEASLMHTEVIGGTGSGKSNTLTALAAQDIADGRGVFVLDPKGDLVEDILKYIPDKRRGDVVVIDPYSDQPVGINPFAAIKTGARPDVVADGILTTFKKLFADAWGKRTEDIMMSSLLTLAKVPDANLLMLPRLLTDANYRAKLVADAVKDDPLGLGSFWESYEAMGETGRRTIIAPLMGRLRSFTLREPLRHVLGQTNPKFDLSELFTKNKIVLVALNKGEGGEVAHLLGSLLVSQIWSLTLARAKVPPEMRNLVSVYIDEMQDYLNLPMDLEQALTQARGLGVGFTLAHQYRAQLSRELLEGMDANIQNRIIFVLSPTDAAAYAKLTGGLLTAEDFIHLRRYHVYLQTLHHNETVWISGQTWPVPKSHIVPVEIRALSRENYGVNKKEVDQFNLRNANLETETAELLQEIQLGVENSAKGGDDE
jgi:hypothetical protein